MRIQSLFYIAVIGFLACSSETETAYNANTGQDQDSNIDSQIRQLQPKKTVQKPLYELCPVELGKNNFLIVIDSISECGWKLAIDDQSEDTIKLETDLGLGVWNKRIRITGYEKIIAEHRFETSMAVGNEGPHIDFTDWKHYTSPWQKLENIGESIYRTMEEDTSMHSKFPSVTAEEKRNAISTYAGNWLHLYDSLLSIDNGYDISYTGVSRYYIRLKGINPDNTEGNLVLVFEIPMGC